MDGNVILIAPLSDDKAARFLIGEAGSPFIQVSLMKFLLSIHKITLLGESTNRAIRTKYIGSHGIISGMCHGKKVNNY